VKIENNRDTVILKPIDYPLKSIIQHIVVFFIFGGIASILMYKLLERTPFISSIPIIFSFAISIGYSIIITIMWKGEKRKGARFIYHKNDKLIELPRENISIKYNNNIYLQIVLGTVKGNQQEYAKVSELQLVDQENKQKWCILASASSFSNAFDYILDDLYNKTHIKIRGGKKKWN
jgi:hypothetical protein